MKQLNLGLLATVSLLSVAACQHPTVSPAEIPPYVPAGQREVMNLPASDGSENADSIRFAAPDPTGRKNNNIDSSLNPILHPELKPGLTFPNRKLPPLSPQSVRPSAPPASVGFGTFLNNTGTTLAGAYAGHTVNLSLALPVNGNAYTLYAPTMLAPNNCPIEAVSVYFNTGTGATQHVFGIWDHADTSGNVWHFSYQDMNQPYKVGNTAKWSDDYIRTYPEGPEYFVQTYRDSSSWYLYVYNQTTSTWDLNATKATSSASSYSNGWDWFEYQFPAGSCPSLPTLRSTNIQVYNGSWKLATPGNLNCSPLPQISPPCAYPNVWPSSHNWYEWQVN